MNAHTPGPWFVDAGMPDVIVDAECDCIAEKVHWLDSQLIAAAPDLLEALKRVLEDIPDVIRNEEMSYIEEAIAKATGQP